MNSYSDLEIDRGVKISGTQYDRRRALSDDEQDYAIYLYNVKGYTLSHIARVMNMSVPGILYIVDPEYKMRKLAYGRNTYREQYLSSEEIQESRKSRIEYKRELLEQGLVRMEK